MPGCHKHFSMDDCMNRGVGLNDGEDFNQAVFPELRDMLYRAMYLNDDNPDNIKLLPAKEQEENVLSINNPSTSFYSSNSDGDMYFNSIASDESEMVVETFSKTDFVNDSATNRITDSDDNTDDQIKTSQYLENLSCDKIDRNISDADSVEKIHDFVDIETHTPVRPRVPSVESLAYFLPVSNNKHNPWRRTIGLHVSGDELRSSTYPARSRIPKLRFAQAKKPLGFVYSYFSIQIIDCEDDSGISIGLTRKDYPSKHSLGKASGSIGYSSDTGSIFINDSQVCQAPEFSKGDVIGCGIVYPSSYKRYIDLSTDDNSDGMTDVVLTSLLNINKQSVNFVQKVLNIVNTPSDDEREYQNQNNDQAVQECEYYNWNYVESRTPVQVYFTYNMQVVGKVLSCIPIGGFYPTVHMFSSSCMKLSVDFSPPC